MIWKADLNPDPCFICFAQIQLQFSPTWEKTCFGKTDPVALRHHIVADTHWPGHWLLAQGRKKGKTRLNSGWSYVFVQLLPVKVVVTNISISNLRTDRFFRDQGDVILPLTLWSGSDTTELQPDSREYANVSLLSLNVVRKTDLANWCV